MAELPKGFTCACGEYHEFPMYLYAHWRDLVDHTCKKCGRVHTLCMGHADEIKGPDDVGS